MIKCRFREPGLVSTGGRGEEEKKKKKKKVFVVKKSFNEKVMGGFF